MQSSQTIATYAICGIFKASRFNMDSIWIQHAKHSEQTNDSNLGYLQHIHAIQIQYGLFMDSTFKAFRASGATALALQGEPLHQILDAGEWKSAAVLRYVSSDALDAGALLTQTVTNDDSD